MIKRRFVGILFIIFGYLMSYALYKIFGETLKVAFHHGDFFWIVGMPIMCVGGVLFLTTLNTQRKIFLGLFGKILLSLLGIIWIVAVYLFFWNRVKF